jgi:hypothetical protein
MCQPDRIGGISAPALEKQVGQPLNWVRLLVSVSPAWTSSIFVKAR